MQQTESIPPTGVSLWISNRDRVNLGESPYDFFVPPLDLSSTNTQTYTVLLKQVLFKNHLHNVIYLESDLLEIYVNNILYVNVFEPGYYTASTLLQSIQSFFNTIDTNLIITYDMDEKKFIITVPLNMNFKFKADFLQSISPYRYNTRNLRFLELIGFQDVNQYSVSYEGPALIVANNPVNLYGTSFIDINFQNSTLNSINSTGSYKTFIRIPITTTYGQLEIFEPGVPVTGNLESSILDNLRILVTDEWGDVVKGPADSLVSLSLLLVPNDF